VNRLPGPLALRLLAGWSGLVLLGALIAMAGTPGAVADAVESAGSADAAVARAGEQTPLSFEVAPGEPGAAVARRLAELGVVTDAPTFTTLLALTGAAPEIQAGCYSVQRGLPAAEMVHRLRHGLTGEDLLRIPEGRRSEEIGELLVTAGLATGAAWREALAAGTRAVGESLGAPAIEGYLLPASYSACNAGAAGVVEAMLAAFTEQVSVAFAAVGRPLDGVGPDGLDLHGVVTLASVVEREAVLREEQARIAGVFLNRLRDGIPLQADPTVQYAVATPDSVAAHGWWKRDLTIADLAADSPYNTYVYAGLPPGPIANPGIDAIRAVLAAEEHDFLYFVARGDGSHVFSRTLDEHNANVERYLGR